MVKNSKGCAGYLAATPKNNFGAYYKLDKRNY